MCKPTPAFPNICGFDPRFELTSAFEHLRQATAVATRAIPCPEGTQAGQRAATFAVEVEAVARAWAGIIDNLDGCGDEPIEGAADARPDGHRRHRLN